ncbi:hypothetical protein ACSMXN_17450 [Jatrophihabitans sp. DSM 45814]
MTSAAMTLYLAARARPELDGTTCRLAAEIGRRGYVPRRLESIAASLQISPTRAAFSIAALRRLGLLPTTNEANEKDSISDKQAA